MISTESMISYKVKVDRKRTTRQAIAATGMKRYVNPDAINAIQQGGCEEIEVFFFRLSGNTIENDELANEYEKRGLMPDPIAQMAVHEAYPEFTAQYRHGTQWKDENGKWCFAVFEIILNEYVLNINNFRFLFGENLYNGGVLK